MKNNLMLNRKTLVVIKISATRCRCNTVHQWLFLVEKEFPEVTLTDKLSLPVHIKELLTKCSPNQNALKTLCSHGMPDSALQIPERLLGNGPGHAELRFSCLVGIHECM